MPHTKESSHDCTVHVLLSHTTVDDSNVLHAINLLTLSTRFMIPHITKPYYKSIVITVQEGNFAG